MTASARPLKRVARRKTTQDLIYDQLSDAFIAGAFKSGSSLTIDALADQFGTSHMPVREALRRLVAEGALEIGTTGTARVPVPTQAGLDALCETRRIVEGAAAELALPRLSDPATLAQLQAVAETHQATLRAVEIEGMLDSNRTFHFMVYEASGNDILVGLIRNLWLRYGPYVRLLSDRMTDLLRENEGITYSEQHRRLIQAVHAGDASGVAQAIRDDISSSQRLLHQFVED